jgi:hypothetical protein
MNANFFIDLVNPIKESEMNIADKYDRTVSYNGRKIVVTF